MKYTCKFCKTVYNLTSDQTGNLQCAVCNHIYNVSNTKKTKYPFLRFIAALCALLSAVIFTFVVIANHRAQEIKKNPLIAEISEIVITTDDSGAKHLMVAGTIVNRSDKIYGLPDLIITCLDDDENVIANQKFMPSATLIDSGGIVKFKHILSGPTNGVKKITATVAK